MIAFGARLIGANVTTPRAKFLLIGLLGVAGCSPPIITHVTNPITTESGWTATNVGFAGVMTLRHDATRHCYLIYHTGSIIETDPEVCR
jgi:hypothetical protein